MLENSEKFIFTSESVSEGHPDKICDQISDLVVDVYMKADRNSRVACETLATTNRIILSGEVKINENIDQVSNEILNEKIREKIKDIGYEQEGFHWEKLDIENHLHQQSKDISQGVDAEKFIGAGDQGIMFGFACSETNSLMPAPLHYSHAILMKLSEYRKKNNTFFGPDSKSQVSMEYDGDIPKKITSIVVSTQHLPDVDNVEIRKKVLGLIESAVPLNILPKSGEILINPTGRFVVGGPDGDTGLTGRKIIVDTYGGAAPHGGGAFSGKDPTKVDRSAAYVSRYLAKNIVAAGFSEKCTIQLAYAIGVAKPLSIYVDTHGTGTVSEGVLEKAIEKVIDLSPRGIREHLQLSRPIYERTAAYGHFGRTPDGDGGFSWEKTDLVEALRSELS